MLCKNGPRIPKVRNASGNMINFCHKLLLVCLTILCVPFTLGASEPDTLVVFDATEENPGELPVDWEHILPKDQFIYTTYNIERSIDGNYLRARSAASGSYLEMDLGEIDISDYRYLSWQWKVDRFPEVEWEQDEESDDFAIRIELVYDFKGSAKNPLNIMRKGVVISLFKWYPPQRIISYVWSVNVPSQESFESRSEFHTSIIPIESSNIIKSRWLRERIDLWNDLNIRESGKNLTLKKIRIRVDTDNTGSMSESGLKFIHLIRGSND